MSGLEDAVHDAYEQAQVSTDPSVWATYHALQGALDAARSKAHEPASTEGIPTPAEAGFVSSVRIAREKPEPGPPPGTPDWWMGPEPQNRHLGS
jgi:hypothetical protein